jgi:hypothetical protein
VPPGARHRRREGPAQKCREACKDVVGFFDEYLRKAELLCLPHESTGEIPDLLAQRPLGPGALAALQQQPRRLFDKGHQVIEQLHAQKVLKGQRRELRVEAARNPYKSLVILAQQ